MIYCAAACVLSHIPLTRPRKAAIVTDIITIMLKKRTGTKQRSDDKTTNFSRLIMFGYLRIDLYAWCGEKYLLVNQVNPKCGLGVECSQLFLFHFPVTCVSGLNDSGDGFIKQLIYERVIG